MIAAQHYAEKTGRMRVGAVRTSLGRPTYTKKDHTSEVA
jgi:hypothetical protein